MASKKSKTNYYSFILLAAILLIGVIFFCTKNNLWSRVSNPSIIDSKTIDGKSNLFPNYKQYVNKDANFTIDYPDYLTRTEFNPVGLPGAGVPAAKRVFFCKTPIDVAKLDFTKGPTTCEGEGIQIQYTDKSVGWGGGCDPENRNTLILMEKSASYCSYDSGFGQLYYGPPQGEENNPQYNSYQFLLGGTYGVSLTKREAEKILATFKVVD